MQRLIPGKTKVSIELFKGITIGDIIVGGVALSMLIVVLISNLPWKLGICIGIVAVAALLLMRLDEQPNYVFLLHILRFLGYDRRFGKVYSDKMLIERGEGRAKDAAFDELFREKKGVSSKERREREKERKKEDKLLNSSKTPEEVKQQIMERRAREAEEEAAARAASGAESAEPAAPAQERVKREKPRAPRNAKQRKEEDKLLKSASVSEEEKDAIRARRAAESEDAMRELAEYREAHTSRGRMDRIIPFTGIRDGCIEYLDRSYYGAVLEIDPVEFRFFSEHRRTNSIENCLGRILRSLHAGYSANIVKLERPIQYDRYLEREYAKLDDLRSSYENGVLSEDELKARVEIEYDRINELRDLCGDNKVISPAYYLCLFESDRHQLEMQIRDAEELLKNGELTVRRLDDKALAVFLKYSNQLDFDEHDVERIAPEDLHLWAQPDTVDFRARRIEVNHIVTHNFRVVNYPTIVGDAFLAGVMSIPGTKVVLKCRPMDRAKAIRNIDHSLQELRGQWSETGVDSKRMEIETHLSTLQELLGTLQSDSESLLECNIYITAYDIVATRKNLRIPQPPESELPTMNDMKKNIRRSWQESGFRLNNMEFDQVQAFIGSQVSALDPLAKEGRGISSNTVAASFPWIYAHISDEGGVKLGESDGVPVFINFFRRDSERVNSNMVIVGKSGSGKSYATKSLLANLAAEDAKIFILDPENEYTELAHNLHGQIINVGNAQYGRLNPFHIITALDDDEAGEGGPSGSYATHLQFLEEFFRQIMPDCEKDAMEYLNTMVDRMYLDRDITGDTDLSKLTPEDYPIFDDLYDQVLQEYQSSDNEFTRDMLRAIMNYVAKFSTGGRNANIWNGPSTITTDENFTVFNFQSMLANRNQTIANAQMLLVLKYIDNEIIKNRDYNRKYKAQRKIVIVIDEAHVFIDAKFPIALDFMFQLAKRIRKYNGMQIVITQNIKDFVGTEELARKSTAIINACQYSFIFALAPNDMSDLVKLYEKAGGINETEQEQIVQAPRGQAFAIMSPTSRSSFRVETASGITEMFEEMDYQTQYFSGVQGAANWEDFIGDSRDVRGETTGETEADENIAQEDGGGHSHISIRVFNRDEYESAKTDEEIDAFDAEEPEEDESAFRRAVPAAAAAAPEPESSRALDMIASALDRISDKLSTGGAPMLAPMAATAYPAMPALDTAGEGSAALLAAQAQLREMNERMRRMEEERSELLRLLNEQRTDERRAEDETETEEDIELYTGDEETELEESAESAFATLDAEAYSEEADGGLLELYSGEDDEEDFDDEDFKDEDFKDEDFESEDFEGEDFKDEDFESEDFKDDDFLDEESGEDEIGDDVIEELDFTDEDLALFSEDADAPAESDGEAARLMSEIAANETAAAGQETPAANKNPDFMSSFCSFAESMRNMNAFDKMRANGKDFIPITLDDLVAEAAAQAERRRLAKERVS